MVPGKGRLRFGFIGLGAIGAPMAMRLFDSGLPLVVWNRSAGPRMAFAERGVDVARSPADLAARCDVVCLCLSSRQAIEDVLFGAHGVAAARPRLVVDHSTIHPDDARSLAGRMREMAGAGWLDAPISGGPSGARAGTLAAMVGGDASDLALAMPALQGFASRVSHTGPVGSGQLAKACNQIIGFLATAALGEAIAFARSSGFDPSLLPDALAGGFADSTVLREYARATAAGEPGGVKGLIDAYADLARGRPEPGLTGGLDLLLKDIGIVTAIARDCGAPLPLFTHVEMMARVLHNQPLAAGPQ